jgi:hypothetical protein
MRKLLFTPLLLITLFCASQDSKAIIGDPIGIGNILVAQYDFPQKLDWREAIQICRTLGKGWRLPTRSEINILYENKIEIGNFSFNSYWCSYNYNPDVNDGGLMKNFKSSVQLSSNSKYDECNVRAVRDKVLQVDVPSVASSGEQDSKTIIGIPIKVGNLLIAQFDFPGSFDWYEAKQSCNALGEGWRLPTMSELIILYNGRDMYIKGGGYSPADRGFAGYSYWSSAEKNDVDAWALGFNNGRQSFSYSKKGKMSVRAVKTF